MVTSARRVARLAKKWQRMARLGRKRLAPTPRTAGESGAGAAVAAGKGHCAVYASDGKRFEVPLAFLGTAAFGELLRMAQEKFGFAGGDGRIMVPCDGAVVEYVMCLLRRNASAEVQSAFQSSMAVPCHYASCAAAAPSLAASRQAAACIS